MASIRTLVRPALVAASLLLLAACGSVASPDGAANELALLAAPNFGPSVYGDGVAWGTKGTTALPAPSDANRQSFDALFVVTNSNNPGAQLPVSEAAPRNPHYNGGRWITYTATWTASGFAAHGTVPLLTSYDDVMLHAGLGHLDLTVGSPPGGPPPYFQCPLLPVK